MEPIWSGTRQIGFITSGAYGHHVKKSLALGYVDQEFVARDAARDVALEVPIEVVVVGERRAAMILAEPSYDPRGIKLRG